VRSISVPATGASARNPQSGAVPAMERRRFGPTGRDVAVIGQGTWYIDNGDRSSAIAAIRCGLDAGMDHIDTAEFYGWGAAETMIGEAILGRRDGVFLVSKVVPQNASRSGTIAACNRSLARLKTDRLDCYLLHWRGELPLEDTVAAFEALERQGKILSWGVSNFDVPDLLDLQRIDGGDRLACNQVLYHLEQRAIEHDVIPWCEKHGVAIVAYSPFGHGQFPGDDSSGGQLLRRIADAHHATPRQVALRFLIRRPSVFAIPKASNPEHALENAGAGRLRLTDAEIAAIDHAFPRGPRPRSLPML
jgi:diketogulonate reductase-like aldo/keto reductase